MGSSPQPRHSPISPTRGSVAGRFPEEDQTELCLQMVAAFDSVPLFVAFDRNSVDCNLDEEREFFAG